MWRRLVLGVVFAATAVGCLAAEPPLPAYNAAVGQTSISGISSGAYMAVQFGMAWSSIVKGVGAIAGGPYGCSEGSLSAALSTCESGQPAPDVGELIRRTDAWSNSGAIDSTGNVGTQKIYLFSGYNDNVIGRTVADALRSFYAHYIGPSFGNLFYQTAIGAGHSQVTLAYGGTCNENGGEYINKCNYDQAGIILQHIYGVLQPRNAGALGGQLLTFDQAEFTAPKSPVDVGMGDKGFAYVPAACAAKEPCLVHVALHGCKQSYAYEGFGDAYVKHAGYNEWADTNHIIVLYPQTQPLPASLLSIGNPLSCWDWWGYIDANPTEQPTYLLKSGAQISVIKAMIDRLTSGATPVSTPPSPTGTAPAALIAQDRSDTAIDVVWSAVPGVTSYDVFRAGPAEAGFHQIGTIGGLSYGDAGLRPATSYRYEVRASGAGAFSPIAQQSTVPRVPPCDDPGTCAVR